MTYTGPWFPLEPLLARYDGCADLARALGINRRSVYVKREKGLTLVTAEEWCDKLRINPAEVWDEWVAAASPPPPQMRECAADDCTTKFVPAKHKPSQRFCSHRCRARIHARKAFAENPEPKRERNRRYDEQNRQTKRRYNRNYYRLVRRPNEAAGYHADAKDARNGPGEAA